MRLLAFIVLALSCDHCKAYLAIDCPSNIPESDRYDCHPDLGATESECLNRGCVWCETSDTSNPEGYPWCFHDAIVPEDCVDCNCANRVDCHPDVGATKSICQERGCFWCESQIPGEPWCYYTQGNSSGNTEGCSSCSCANKVDCHPQSGATQETCEGRGCLWCPTSNNDPWCVQYDAGCSAKIPESARIDCWPEEGANLNDCVSSGCLWCETNTAGIPWCFYDTTDLPEGIPDGQRINCMPEGGLSQSICESRGCEFASVESSKAPTCYFPETYGYRMVGSPVQTSTGYEITLERASSATLYGNDAELLTLMIDFDTDYRIHWKITDQNDSNRFEVPISIDGAGNTIADNPLYQVNFTNNQTFSFQIIRKSSGTVLWDTSLGGLTFSNQFLQISTHVPVGTTVYGFGETEHDKLKHSFDWSVWGMYTRDEAPSSGNLYSAHPFYVGIEEDSNAHGVLFLNAAAQDVTFTPAPGLIYRTIGGVLDFYMFLGPDPNTVVEQYSQAIGLPFFPPYWSLGFQLCRWGYGDLATVQKTVSRMDEYKIPLDVQYGDIDYMDGQRDFTIDQQNYAYLPEYVKELQASGKHYVIILDPCLTADDPNGTYPSYERGVNADAYVKNSDGTYTLGKVWPPGDSVFPDYSKPSAQEWWENECKLFHETLNFDGLWIDMNEPANFVTGSVNGCANNNVNYPPYHPHILGKELADKTLCPDAQHYAGSHYDTHSMYGYFEAITTYKAAYESTGLRPFVVSRSTFPGSGKYTAHWLGDNYSAWKDLKNSIIGMLEFNMFGIPYVGADICGFSGTATNELCSRWMELGAFYPYSRNHNGIGNPVQDPAAFGDAFALRSRNVLLIRYTLLPYLYTLFYEANTKGTGVVRPMSFEFTSDKITHDIDEQFLWGGGVLFSPVVREGAATVNAYFPDARWYDYRDGFEIGTRGSYRNIDAPLGVIPIHIRGGFIIPTQEPDVNTVLSSKNPFGLIIALDDAGMASGSLFWDGLDIMGTIESNQYALFQFNIQNGILTTNLTKQGIDISGLKLGNVRVFGVTSTPASVTVNGITQVFTYSNNVVEVTDINEALTGSLVIQWQ